jgi:hypothetical protein
VEKYQLKKIRTTARLPSHKTALFQ